MALTWQQYDLVFTISTNGLKIGDIGTIPIANLSSTYKTYVKTMIDAEIAKYNDAMQLLQTLKGLL